MLLDLVLPWLLQKRFAVTCPHELWPSFWAPQRKSKWLDQIAGLLIGGSHIGRLLEHLNIRWLFSFLRNRHQYYFVITGILVPILDHDSIVRNSEGIHRLMATRWCILTLDRFKGLSHRIIIYSRYNLGDESRVESCLRFCLLIRLHRLAKNFVLQQVWIYSGWCHRCWWQSDVVCASFLRLYLALQLR